MVIELELLSDKPGLIRYSGGAGTYLLSNNSNWTLLGSMSKTEQ